MHIRPMLEYIKKNYDGLPLMGCEIGVQHGINARDIMQNLNIEKLFLVDPYLPYIDNDGFIYNKNFLGVYFTAKRNLRGYSNAVFIRQKSKSAVKMFKDGVFDWIYIDGNHREAGLDLRLWYPKVKPGGVIGGHDFNTVHNQVVLDVLEFIDLNGLELYDLVEDDYWILKPNEGLKR